MKNRGRPHKHRKIMYGMKKAPEINKKEISVVCVYFWF